MGKIAYTLCMLVAVSAIGCASNTPIPLDTQTDQAAACIQAITTSRKAATALLRAGKISLARDQEVQDSLNTARVGCVEMSKGATP